MEDNKVIKFGERVFNFSKENLPDLPSNMERVTAGNSGESILIIGSEKTALYDCGMAYCGEEILEKIRVALKKHDRNKLDIIMLSHSHFDHIGALPYIREAHPEATVYAAEKCMKIFERPNAKALIKKLGEDAREQYGNQEQKAREIKSEGLKVDIAVKTGDKIHIGKEQYIEVLEAKGHTDCSTNYILHPENMMFVCESTGVLKRGNFGLHTAAVKSPLQCLETAKNCMEYDARQLMSIHFGLVPIEYTRQYFEKYMEMAIEELRAIEKMHKEGKSQEEIVDAYQMAYYNDARKEVQPLSAFRINASNAIKVAIAEIEEGLLDEYL